MRTLIKILIILNSICCFGQDNLEKEFHNLEIADTLSNNKDIAYYQSKSQFKNDDFFIYDGQLQNQRLNNSYLFKEYKTGFIIYLLPFQNSLGILFSKIKIIFYIKMNTIVAEDKLELIPKNKLLSI